MSNAGHKHTEEWKRQASARFSGTNNPMFGRVFTDEHRQRMSVGQKACVTNSGRFKNGQAPTKGFSGRHHTEESKKKTGRSLMGNKNSLGSARPWTDEQRKHMSEIAITRGVGIGNKYCVGRKYSEETLKKMSLAHKGAIVSIETRLKQGRIRLGRRHTEETKNKISMAHMGKIGMGGEKNPNWRGGKTFELYPQTFSNKLKKMIKDRDGWTCQECGYSYPQVRLHVHHIDYDKKNNVESNLITLCNSCHSQTNFKREDWEKYFKDKVCLTSK